MRTGRAREGTTLPPPPARPHSIPMHLNCRPVQSHAGELPRQLFNRLFALLPVAEIARNLPASLQLPWALGLRPAESFPRTVPAMSPATGGRWGGGGGGGGGDHQGKTPTSFPRTHRITCPGAIELQGKSAPIRFPAQLPYTYPPPLREYPAPRSTWHSPLYPLPAPHPPRPSTVLPCQPPPAGL